jgi:methionyl-tRNA formyltransferase
LRIGILASGSLGLEVLKKVLNVFRPQFLATDHSSVGLVSFAAAQQIPLFKGNPRNGKLRQFLDNCPVDLIFSINYVFLIERDVLQVVRHAINFHGSLLPKYRGRTPHVWAIINNEKVTGVTAHLIDEECDTGPVIMQREIEIGDADTGGDLLKKFTIIYPEILREIYADALKGNLQFRHQDTSRATYFGKRTPEDGRIDWNWQKERIYNWVRAQANPYPGAFTSLDNHKIVIDRVAFHDGGFAYDDPNGLIKSLDPLLVKSPNGLVELRDVREGRGVIMLDKILA